MRKKSSDKLTMENKDNKSKRLLTSSLVTLLAATVLLGCEGDKKTTNNTTNITNNFYTTNSVSGDTDAIPGIVGEYYRDSQGNLYELTTLTNEDGEVGLYYMDGSGAYIPLTE